MPMPMLPFPRPMRCAAAFRLWSCNLPAAPASSGAKAATVLVVMAGGAGCGCAVGESGCRAGLAGEGARCRGL